MGFIAFLLDWFVDTIVHFKWLATQELLYSNIGLSWLVFVVIGVVLMFMAACLTAYVGPAALGSGVAEAMGFLNGVIYPEFIHVKTLFTKIVGVMFAVAAGLCGGKEGPLVHIGSNVGVMTLYLPFKYCKYFQNDHEKRKFIAVGLAAGVAAAFGAPIGGSLFAYELSKPNTFWSFSLTWRVFFACSMSTFFLNIFKSLQMY